MKFFTSNVYFQDLGFLLSAIDKGSNVDHCLEKKPNVSLEVGKVIKDKVPKEEIKLIRFPLKQSHLSLNLSDEAFQKMGDTVADNIDTGHAEISTGKQKIYFQQCYFLLRTELNMLIESIFSTRYTVNVFILSNIYFEKGNAKYLYKLL